jgi:GNAT superfamily N-acetyltransferase
MAVDGNIRPVNLRSDLSSLADLIELVFAPTMDDGGRAAIREMRYMSRMGVGLSLVSRLNDMMLGIKMGYVWIEDGKLVGNVSIYPANLPDGQRNVWIIANVGVHPTYQGRGIARKLMIQCLDMLRERGGRAAILQVDQDNDTAIHLYERLGFVRERGFTQWRRSSLSPVPQPVDTGVFITRRRRSEWQAELHLAQQVRPNRLGGMGWLKPTTEGMFQRSMWRELLDTLSMNSTERLVVRSVDETTIVASVWIENSFASFTTSLTLMHLPNEQPAMHTLLNNVVRRFRTSSLSVEHPSEDEATNDLLEKMRFLRERSVYHMRLGL